MTTTTTTKTGSERPPHPTGHRTGGKPTTLHAVTQVLATHPGATTAELAHAAGLGRSTTGKALVTLQNTGTAQRQERGRDRNNRRTPDRWYPTHQATTEHPTADPVTDTETQTGTDTKAPTATDAAPDNAAQDTAPDSGSSPNTDPAPDNEKTQTGTEPTASADDEPRAPAATQAEANTAQDTALAPDAGGESGTAPMAQPTGSTQEPAAPAGDSQASTSTPTPAPATAGGGNVRLRPGALREMVVVHLTAHPREAFTATGISRAIGKSSGAIANALVTLTKQGITHQVTNHPRRYQFTPTGDRQQ